MSRLPWALAFLALAFVPDQKILRHKLLAVEAGVWAALLLVLARAALAGPAARWRRTPLDFPTALYAAGALAFYALSPERGVSALELTRALFCAAVFFAAAQSLRGPEDLRRAAWAFSLPAALVSAYALLQLGGGFGPLAVPHSPRPAATFGNPIFLAAYLAAGLLPALALAAAERGRSRALAAAAATLCAAGLWAAQSRAALLGAGTAAALGAALLLRGKARRTALAGLLVAGAAAAWASASREWTHVLIWRGAAALWLSQPWLGVGLGRFHVEFPAFASEALRDRWPQNRMIVNFAHNEYLQTLCETGIAGAALLLLLLSAWGVSAIRTLRRAGPGERPLAGAFGLSAAALLLQGFFSPDLRFGLSSFLLYFAMAASLAPAGREVPLPRPRLAAGAGAALLAAWGWLALQPWLAQRRLAREPDFHAVRGEELRPRADALEARLAADPSDAEAAERLGYLYARLKDWTRAAARYELAARLAPGRPGPYNNLGNIFYSAGDRQGAIRWWRRSLDVRPEQLDAHLNLAKALYESGRLKEAAAHAQEALRRDPASEKAQVLLRRMVE